MNNCPYYEEHGGEYYQGMWEFTDACYFSQLLDYNTCCSNNPNCWYKRKNANKEILQLIEKYFGPSHAYNIDEDGNLYEEKLFFKCEPQKDNYVEHIKRIIETLEKENDLTV